MKQFQYSFESTKQFHDCITNLKKEISDDCRAIFQIFSDKVSEEIFTMVTDILDVEFPNSNYFGCTTSGNIGNCEIVDNILVSCTIFEKADTFVTVEQYDLNESLERITKDILEKSQNIPNVKAIELYFSNTEISNIEFCDRLDSINKDIHIFGAVAGNNDMALSDSLVCSKGNPLSDTALIAVFYSGSELYVESLKATGWKPIGKYFEITKAEGSIIYELDKIPAYNIYKQYFNIENDENFFVNSLEFPLFYQDNNEEILKAPLTGTPDNALVMLTEIEVGKKVRLSYGDPQSIIEGVDKDVDILRDFTPDVIHVFSCAARKTFWGVNEATYELESLKDIADSNGFFSYGEFLKSKNHLNKHNVTLVLAAMREGNSDRKIAKRDTAYRTESKIPLITRLTNFIRETTNQINEANKMLYEERMHYHNVLTSGCEYNLTGDLTDGIVRGKAYDKQGRDIATLYNIASEMTFDDFIKFYLDFHTIQYVDQTKRELGEILSTEDFLKRCSNCLTREGLLKQFENGVSRVETVFYETIQKRYMRISVYMSENEQNKHVFALILVQDVTAQWNEDVVHENQLREAIELANQVSEAKTSFLANMSHELRTPINVIIGFNEMILRENQDANISEYATNAKNAADALLMLVNDVLDFSKIEAGKMEIAPMDYSVKTLLNSVMSMMTERAESKGLALYLNCDKNVPEYLSGDLGRIQQILINLLSNAIKYTDKGTVTLKVSANIYGDTADVLFSVKDTGIGIKEDDIDRLFNEFERIDLKRNRNIEGTGLGLNITTGLLRLMNSKLNVQSVYGEGSEFSFTIKQNIVSTKVDSSEAIQVSERIRFTAPDFKLLIVDDNKMNRMVFANLLKETMIKVDQAESGAQCIEMVSNKEYDIIMLDHMMPEMDGIEALSIMLNQNLIDIKKTPVIALTANAIAGAKEMYLEHGFTDYLAKPVKPNDLNAMILKYIPQGMIHTV